MADQLWPLAMQFSRHLLLARGRVNLR